MGVLSKTMPNGEPRKNAWSKGLASERKKVVTMELKCLALITLVLWTILSIYFGVYYRQTENAYRLTVRIIDMDSQYASVVPGAPSAILGPAIVQAAKNNAAANPHYHLGWQYASADELQQLRVTPNGQGRNASEYAEYIVTNEDVFGAIVINPNATALATEAALTGNSAYDPRGAVSFFYSEARNFYATNQYVTLFSTKIIQAGIAQASRQLALQTLSRAAPTANGGTANATALTTALAGNALSYPFYYNEHNLNPFDQLAGEAATTAGQIYLIILTFFSSPIWKGAFEPLRRKLTMPSMLFLHWIVPVMTWFWISLCYSLVTLAFHVDFTRKYGYGGFPLFWAMNWTSMTALGFVMETMLRLAGPLLFPFFLVFWVIWNVSTAFLDLSQIDHFYQYGYAFPVWNSIDSAKSIIFGTKNHLTQNFMVCLGWVIGGSIALLSIAAWQRHQDDKKEYEERLSRQEKVGEQR